MLRRFPSARRTAVRGFGSAVTMAIAIAGGAAVVTAATTVPAAAQRSSRSNAPQTQNSEAFVTAFQPVADIVNAEGGDLAAARAQVPALVAAISTPDDRNAAGNLILMIGNKLKDAQLQRQGLELMVASGKTDPAQLGQFQYFIGSLAYDARDWAPSRAALQAALAAGYTGEGNPEAMIAETYFGENQAAQGLDYLKGLVDVRTRYGSAPLGIINSVALKGNVLDWIEVRWTGKGADRRLDPFKFALSWATGRHPERVPVNYLHGIPRFYEGLKAMGIKANLKIFQKE